MAGPLSHVRVLDLSRIMAGPWAGQILADLGADVVKVERPGAGDDTRGWGPPFLKDRSGAETREAGYYLSVNRGKRSITLELDKPEGQRVVRALAERSDIVLENFKVGTLARFGLGYEQLKAVNPKLIYCSITGFGQSGPRREAAAYDFMIQAMCGLMSVTGEPDDKPGGCPEKVGVPIVDIMSGMYAAISVLAALARRNETGRGDYIDIGMLDVGVACLANQAMNYLVSGKVPRRTGNAHPNIQPQDVFATPRRPHGAGGRQRRPVRQVLRGARAAGMGHRRPLRQECRTGAQPRGAETADRRNPADARHRRLDRAARSRRRALRPDQHRAAGVRRGAGAPPRHAGRHRRIRWRARCRRW